MPNSQIFFQGIFEPEAHDCKIDAKFIFFLRYILFSKCVTSGKRGKMDEVMQMIHVPKMRVFIFVLISIETGQ